MIRPPDQQLIALCTFLRGDGMVRRGSVYTEDGRKVRERLHQRQAMEDVTVIDGVTVADAKKLGRAGILTLEHLRIIEVDHLAAAGLRQAAIDAILAWRGADGEEDGEGTDPATPPTGLEKIGLTATNVKKLQAAGLDTLDKVVAAPAEALEGLKLSKTALEALLAWRQQLVDAELAEKRETKG